MSSIKEKTIKGKKYLYAEYSFRLPDGKIKKISKLIKNKEDFNNKEIKDYFLKKEVEANQYVIVKKYKADSVLTEGKLRKIEENKIKYKHIINSLTKNQIKDILDRFTVNFTYESNAIEGNSLTLKDVTMILSENIVPEGKNLREIYETKNTRKANELVFENRFDVTIKDIIKIHKILVENTGVQTGFKKLPNFLLMRNVRTTAPENVEGEMTKLVRWYHENKNKLHPVRLASEFHGIFERIHPFEDGNGRVGRMLINVILVKNKYSPIIIRKTMRPSYFSALEAHDNGYKDKLLRFIIEKVENTFKNFFEIYVKYL